MFRQIGPNGLGHLGIVRIKAGQHGGGGVIRSAAQSVGDSGAGLAQTSQAQVEAHALQSVDGAEGLGQFACIQKLVEVGIAVVLQKAAQKTGTRSSERQISITVSKSPPQQA